MTLQVAIRLPDDVAAMIDDLVAGGRYSTRTAVIRAAIKSFVDVERGHLLDEAIAEGYRRLPESDEDIAVAVTAARRLVQDPDLPW